MKELLGLVPTLIFLLQFTVVKGQAELRFEHFSVEQGLSHNSVWSICQDREGFMWFGTVDGLNKYDGYTFTTFRADPRDPNNTLQHNVISDIYEDRTGRLWVTTFGGGLHEVDKRTGRVTPYRIDPNHVNHWNVVFSICEDHKGILWLGADYGIARFDPKSKQYTLYPTPDKSGAVGVSEDKDGNLWGGAFNKVFKFDRLTGKYAFFPLAALDNSSGISSFYLDAEGIAWIGSRGNGLFRMDTRRTPVQFQPYNPGKSVNRQIWFNGIYESNGYLWIATNKGLQTITPKTGQVITYQANPSLPAKLSSNIVQAIYQDRSGAFWAGTEFGINKGISHSKKFNAKQLRPTLPSIRLNENRISAILEDKKGTLWVATAGDFPVFENRLFYYDKRKRQWDTVPVNPNDSHSLFSSKVWALYEDKKGHLWIGTTEGLHRLNRSTNSFTRYPSRVPIQLISEDAWGNLWVGGDEINNYSAGIASFDPLSGRFNYYFRNKHDSTGLNNSYLHNLLASRSGDIWVATAGGGLNRLNPKTGKFTYYLPNYVSPEGSLNDKETHGLYEDESGIIWVGTALGGLHRFDPKTERFTYFTTKNGLPNNYITSITADDSGNLWIGTYNGLCRFNPKTNTFRNYDVSDGLPDNEFVFGSVYKRNRKLFFGTVNGFVEFYPDSIRDNTTPPPVYITGFKVLEKKRDLPKDKIELPYKENFLSFDFVALNYDAPNKNQYAFQLVGLDKDWIYSGNRRFASYTNLGPGKYVFRVKASNNDGAWNEQGTSVSIVILPPWWRTWWAYTIFAVLFAGLIYVFIRYRINKIRMQHEIVVQKHKATELEMQALRAQMNPHFIFNSLNSINRFILQNNKLQASEYLTKFSRLVRLILQNSQASLIPLESELEALQLYLELEAVRFDHQFEYTIKVDSDLDADILKVPPLIIQPYAENAIWHGLMHKEEKGHLEIELFQCDEVLCCKITDDGIGRKKAAELKSNSASTHRSMGMRITADRIAMLQQKKQLDTTIKITDLILPDGSAGGTEVLLQMPVMR